MKEVIAIYPGTFDPPTYGHLDMIKRAHRICKKLIVAVSEVGSKENWFSVDRRVKILKQLSGDIEGVEIDTFDKLLVDYAKDKGAGVIIRGIRAVSDFEYEFKMALTNRTMAPDIETVFMMPHESYSYLSSSLIKEIVKLKGDVKKFVPPIVEKELKKR